MAHIRSKYSYITDSRIERERERGRERERVWGEKNNIRMRFFQNIMCNQQRIFGRRARYVFYNNTFIFDVSCLYLD